MRRSCLTILVAASLVSGGAASRAVAQSYPEDAERLCTGDAFRLCSSDIPFVDRVTACMIRRQNELSPECRAVVAAQAPAAAVARAPASRSKPRKPPSIFQDDE